VRRELGCKGSEMNSQVKELTTDSVADGNVKVVSHCKHGLGHGRICACREEVRSTGAVCHPFLRNTKQNWVGYCC
jgi:hypothetical protein